MKKIYFAPETKCLKIEVKHHLMDASNGTLSTQESNRLKSSGDFGSRGRGRFFDDDED